MSDPNVRIFCATFTLLTIAGVTVDYLIGGWVVAFGLAALVGSLLVPAGSTRTAPSIATPSAISSKKPAAEGKSPKVAPPASAAASGPEASPAPAVAPEPQSKKPTEQPDHIQPVKIEEEHSGEQRKTLEESTAETEALYTKFRAEADEHAKLRAKYFEDAAKAHDAGDGALAKELSTKGKEEGKLMEEASLRAARAIFAGKNKEQPQGTIDLHGLHVKEAELIVTEELAKAKQGGLAELKIIIGAGHHSDENGPKVGPAIKKLLDSASTAWKDDETNNSGGAIIATL